jgi:hypothetical protein
VSDFPPRITRLKSYHRGVDGLVDMEIAKRLTQEVKPGGLQGILVRDHRQVTSAVLDDPDDDTGDPRRQRFQRLRPEIDPGRIRQVGL